MKNLNGMDLQPMLFWVHSEARAIIVCGDCGRASKSYRFACPAHLQRTPLSLSPTVFLPPQQPHFFPGFSIASLVSWYWLEVADGALVLLFSVTKDILFAEIASRASVNV